MGERTKENKRFGITPTQVIASALAAITAAFLGSTLGVAGTVIGAGIASLVSTVGSAIYQHSLDRTGSTLRSKVGALRADSPSAASVPGASGGTLAGFTGVLEPGFAGDESPTRQLRPASVSPPDKRWRWPRWQVLTGVTVVAFVLGMGVVTAVEWLHGGPISGGNAGTTVGSLFGESTQHNTQSTTTVTPTATTTPATTMTTAPTTTASPATAVEPSVTTTPSTATSTATTTTTPIATTSAAPASTP